MKLSATSSATLALAAVASASPLHERSSHEWVPAGPNDLRGPCPMLNTLANHAFLPHDGGNITLPVAIRALSEALNFGESVSAVLWAAGVTSNPEPGATYFTLEQLGRHNVVEHDASISRNDAFFGNHVAFNQTVFDKTKKYWTGPVLDAAMLANAKLARGVESKAHNPEYTFPPLAEAVSLSEMASPVLTFGDMDAVKVDRELVEYLFENERLPYELGWTRRKEVVRENNVLYVIAAIRAAASLITPPDLDLASKPEFQNLLKLVRGPDDE